jgi:starvation-inducible DNA-binding protein
VLLPNLVRNSLNTEEDDLSPKAISREVVFFLRAPKIPSATKIHSDHQGPAVMVQTRNDLPAETRKKNCTLLNERLRDSIKLGLNAKQAHWNVKGVNFIALHKLFDEVYAATQEFVDEIAERITALGGLADGSVPALNKSHLPDHPVQQVDWKAHVAALADELAAYGKLIRKNIDETAADGDAGTSDLLTGIVRDVDKYLWFVEAHLQD